MTLQISDVDGALVRTFLSPAHMRAALLVNTQNHDSALLQQNRPVNMPRGVLHQTAAESLGWILPIPGGSRPYRGC